MLGGKPNQTGSQSRVLPPKHRHQTRPRAEPPLGGVGEERLKDLVATYHYNRAAREEAEQSLTRKLKLKDGELAGTGEGALGQLAARVDRPGHAGRGHGHPGPRALPSLAHHIGRALLLAVGAGTFQRTLPAHRARRLAAGGGFIPERAAARE